MREFVLIGLGAIFGANLRYWVANVFAQRFGLDFPYGTLFINISGSFVLGFILTVIGNRLVSDPGYRLLLGTGFLGAYTTFSTFSYEAVALLRDGEWTRAGFYVAASVLLSIAGTFLGFGLAREITAWRGRI